MTLCDGRRQSCQTCSDEALKIGGTLVPELALYQTLSLDLEADPNLDVLFMEELDIPIGGKTKDSSIQQQTSWCAKRVGACRI